MKPNALILIGAGGHARSCIDVIEQYGQYKISGLVGLTAQKFTEVLGYPVVGTDEDLEVLKESSPNALITIGQIHTSVHRKRLHQKLLDLHFVLPTIIAPTAYVSPYATIGAGTVVMHGAIVNAGAKIGRNCIINTKALIEHDVVIEDHCHISTGAILNGGVHLSSGSFLGSGSMVKEDIIIGRDCLVGIGCVVRNTLLDFERLTSGPIK